MLHYILLRLQYCWTANSSVRPQTDGSHFQLGCCRLAHCRFSKTCREISFHSMHISYCFCEFSFSTDALFIKPCKKASSKGFIFLYCHSACLLCFNLCCPFTQPHLMLDCGNDCSRFSLHSFSSRVWFDPAYSLDHFDSLIWSMNLLWLYYPKNRKICTQNTDIYAWNLLLIRISGFEYALK